MRSIVSTNITNLLPNDYGSFDIFLLFFTSMINRELFNYNFNLYIFLLPSLFILCIYTYCTVLLLYCSVMTNALHTYVDCDWFHICKDLRKVNKYDIWYDMIWQAWLIHNLHKIGNVKGWGRRGVGGQKRILGGDFHQW